jgi:heptaprenyl diphosphate synthase
MTREEFRMIRQEYAQKLFSSRALCIAGLCAMPALVFNPSPVWRVFQFLFFWFLAWLSGKKNNPLITILIILGILLFNLLVPYGRVLFTLGAFRITEGALLAGLQRGVTLEALVMLSRFSIRRDLRLPGAFGQLLGESFRIFGLIMDRKRIITRGNLMAGIDALLIELSETPPEEGAGGRAARDAAPQPGEGILPGKRGPGGRFLLVAVVSLAWLPVVLQFFPT